MTYRRSMSDAIREVQESTIKPYVSMSSGGEYNVLDKDSKVAFSTKDKTLAYDYFKKNFQKLKENEDHEVSLDEGKMSDIHAMMKDGKSAAEIAKALKLDYQTVKDILGEEVSEEQLSEFTSDMIKRLQKSYATMPQKISPEQATALSKHLDRLDLVSLKQLIKANIPFVSTVAKNKVYKKTGKFEEVELEEKTYGWTLVSKAKDLAKKFANNMSKAVDEIEKLEKGLSKNSSVEQELRKYNEEVEEPKKDMPDDKERVAKESSDKEIASLKDQINILKTKLENEKHKAVKPEPNPKTGEVPLTVGVAYKHFRAAEDKEKKEEVSEAITVKKYKNAVDPTKDGLQISKTSGMGGSIFIKDKKELKDLLDKIDKNKGNLKEDAKSDKEKRLQKAKDMIKYYDAQKKAALNGKNKDLAKKMLKNDSDRIKDDPCWTGYKMVGMKKGKGGKEVPNCVPEGAVKLVDKLLSKKLKEKQK